MATNEEINLSFLKISRRSENNNPDILIQTFVNAGPLLALLSSNDHQIIFGRRGTGKTHALVYLGDVSKKDGGIPVYIDLRQIGSTGGLFSDTTIALSERATRLLCDTIAALHASLLDFFVQHAQQFNLHQFGPILDKLAEAVTEVYVAGATEVENSLKTATSQSDERSFSAQLSASPSLKIESITKSGESNESGLRTKQSGTIQHRVHFGRIATILKELTKLLNGRKILILLDEWSVIPSDLQPFLADFIRRSLFPIKGIVVKIGAIEQRVHFNLPLENGEYIGIELGADASADLHLDDIMVFDNDPEKATHFFQELLWRHFVSVTGDFNNYGLTSSADLIKQAFTQINVFEELVRASEGVPRDFINLINLAAQKSSTNAISIEDIRVASRQWYQRDKEKAVTANQKAHLLLHWIIEKVIAHRRARAFLLKSNERNELIDSLFDARVLHLLKRNIAAHDQPGIRFDVFKLDYGCYVDIIVTSKAPLGLLPAGDQSDGSGGYIEVPPDDYRAIRRAILDLNEFEKH